MILTAGVVHALLLLHEDGGVEVLDGSVDIEGISTCVLGKASGSTGQDSLEHHSCLMCVHEFI